MLHRITRALFDAGLDVVSARVSTLGEMVVDAFYVRQPGVGKVTDAVRLEEITTALGRELGLSPGSAGVQNGPVGPSNPR
jgi:[protein-PII] uridylyltransferase